MPANYRKMRKHYQQREYVETGRERGYLRIMCCCITWERGPRAYREPPPELIAARKSGFRHGADPSPARSSARSTTGRSSARGSRVAPAVDVVGQVPDHPRHRRAGGDDPLSRARGLACYADFVNGVDGDGKRDNGTAALLAACHVGDVELVEALVNAGLFLNAKAGKRNETALIVAAKAGQFEACDWLFSNGADMTAVDVAGRNAADHARFAGHHELAEVLHQYGCPSVEVID